MNKEDIKERDTLFCELLFELGSVRLAAEELGITVRTGRKIADANKDLILSMTNTELSSLAYKAVKGFRDALDEDGSTAKAEVRLKAAEGILDRIGAAKKQTTELDIKTETPIILMPAKDTVVLPTISVSSQEESI